MKKKKNVDWIINELTELAKDKVITNTVARKIQRYYEERIDRKNIALTIFSVIGTALIGLGIISIIGYNWTSIPRMGRAVIAMTPLTISVIVAIILFYRDIASEAWREGVAIFWVMSIGAAIALISQTYNIPGDLGSFLLVWSVLMVPIAYLMRSVTSSVLYLAGITIWAIDAQIEGGTATLFWGLFAVFIPIYIIEMIKNKYSNSVLWMSWMICICLTVAAGVVLEKCVPGLWMIVYSSFFLILYLLAKIFYDDATLFKQMPFHLFGIIGMAVISFLLTFQRAWVSIGWNYFRSSERFQEWAAYFDYVFVVVLLIAAFLLLRYTTKLKKKIIGELGVFPFLAALVFLVVSQPGKQSDVVNIVINVAKIIMNMFFLFLSIRVVWRGINLANLTVLNGGMLMFIAIIMARVADVDIGFLTRGVIFIVLGIGFIMANIIMARKKVQK